MGVVRMVHTVGGRSLILGLTVFSLIFFFVNFNNTIQHRTTTTSDEELDESDTNNNYEPFSANHEKVPSANLDAVEINNSIGKNLVNGVLTSHLYEAGFDIPNRNICANLGASLNILVLIASAPNNADARMAIRHTWGQFAQQKGIAFSFVLARADTPELNSSITLESDLYSDIIGCRFIDSYNNLTLKTICMMDWIDNFCPKVKFILKAHDDVFLNIPKLLSFVEQRSDYMRIIFGALHTRTRPLRNALSKWFVSREEYAPDIYPDYADGEAYLLTGDIVHDLYVTALNTAFFKIEDLFMTGIVAQAINVERIHVNKFINGTPSSSKEFTKRYFEEYLSIRVANFHEQYDLWKILHENDNYKPVSRIELPAANLSEMKINNSVGDKLENGVLISQLYEGGYDIPNKQLCPNLGASLKLLILIPSAPINADARLAIRHTWGQYAQQKGIGYSFVLAQNETPELTLKIRSESDLYRDIIGCRFLDSYDNLTLKTTCMMQWIDIYCPKVKFILKADDDMFVNIPYLISFVEQRSNYRRKIFGKLHIKTAPIRDEAYKWFVPKAEYAPDIYPDYADGETYLLTGDIARDLYVTALNTTFFRMEDVFMTGIVAEAIDAERIYENKMFMWYPSSSEEFNKRFFEEYVSIRTVQHRQHFINWKMVHYER